MFHKKCKEKIESLRQALIKRDSDDFNMNEMSRDANNRATDFSRAQYLNAREQIEDILKKHASEVADLYIKIDKLNQVIKNMLAK